MELREVDRIGEDAEHQQDQQHPLWLGVDVGYPYYKRDFASHAFTCIK